MNKRDLDIVFTAFHQELERLEKEASAGSLLKSLAAGAKTYGAKAVQSGSQFASDAVAGGKQMFEPSAKRLSSAYKEGISSGVTNPFNKEQTIQGPLAGLGKALGTNEGKFLAGTAGVGLATNALMNRRRQ